MKKLVLSALMTAGLSASLLAQSQFTVDNLNNSSLNPADTANGLFWVMDPSGTTLLDPNIYPTLNAAVYTSTTQFGTYTLKATFTGANALAGLDLGLYFDPNSTIYNVTGIGQNGNAWIRLDVWLPGYTQNGGDGAATKTFLQPTGGASVGGNPPTNPADFTSMPAMVIPVPEPSTFALAGLGLASLLIFRRRY